jgi:hypothetical protein
MRTSMPHIAAIAMLVLMVGSLDACNSPQQAASTGSPAGQPGQATTLSDAEIKYGVSPTRNDQVTYQDDVIVMEHGAEAIRGLSSNGLTYTLDANAPGAKDIQQDKILFATGRVVGRVLEVKRNGNDVAVTLGPIELTEVFKEAHISYHGTLDPDKMIVYQAPPDYPGTFIDQDAPEPNTAEPTGAMPLPGKSSIRFGALSPAGELISLPTGRYGARNAAWVDGDREHFRRYATHLVTELQGRYDNTDCSNAIAVSAIVNVSPKMEPNCGGSGGAPTVADIVLGGAHFLPNFSQGLGVSASSTEGGMTFTTSAKLHLDQPDFTFNLDITGGRLKTAEVELNVSGGLKVAFKGATGGEFKNFNKVTAIPLDLSIPIPTAGGFAATFHQAILIQTMFTAKQAMIDVAGDYTLSGSIKAGIVNGKPGGTSDVSLTVNQGLGASLNGVSVGINGLVLGYSAKFIAGIGAYSFVVGPYASVNTTVGATRGSDAQTAMVGYTCRSAEFHMWLDYGVGVAVPNFVVKILNGILSVFSSKATISSSYSTKLGKVIIKDIMEYIPAGCAPKA